MSDFRFEQIQHPVGQGGFHSGCLFRPGEGQPSFLWIYDCGSDQSLALAAQVRNFAGHAIHALFLSHLDDDHVNGVDSLLRSVSGVDEVVLPYLNDVEWTLHLAASAAAGRLTANFVDLVADPAKWLGERGVSRITYVESGDGDMGVSTPDPGEPHPSVSDWHEAGIDEGPLSVVWSRDPRVISAANANGVRAEVAMVSRGAVANIKLADTRLNWVLAPFAFRPSTKKFAAFQRMLDAGFGPGRTVGEYADFARTQTGRAGLRMCFDAVWKKHNLHSMTLYAGPAIRGSDKILNTAWHGKFVRRVVQPGWISTGDYDTSVKKRRDALARYYWPYAAMVGQIGLPHHGSDLSFDEEILDAFPDLNCAIAAVGTNSHGHPGLGVQTAVAARSELDFVRVDENPLSVYRVRGPVQQ